MSRLDGRVRKAEESLWQSLDNAMKRATNGELLEFFQASGTPEENRFFAKLLARYYPRWLDLPLAEEERKAAIEALRKRMGE